MVGLNSVFWNTDLNPTPLYNGCSIYNYYNIDNNLIKNKPLTIKIPPTKAAAPIKIIIIFADISKRFSPRPPV